MMPVLDEKIMQAREQGHSWEDIYTFLEEQREKALQQGHTQGEIDSYLGYKSPAALEAKMRARAEASVKAATPESGEKKEYKTPMEGFMRGLQAGASGYVIRGKHPDTIAPTDGTYAASLAEAVGVAISDLPFLVAGAIGGAALGGGAGTAAAPGPGTLTGAVLGAGAGGFALPAVIKAEYVDGLNNGAFKGPGDYARRQAAIWWEAAKGAMTGAATVAAGEGGALIAAGAKPIVQGVAKTAAELATMVSVSKGLEGQLPTPEDLLDGAVVLGAFKTGAAGIKYAKGIKENLAQHWTNTDEFPVDAANRALYDPLLRQQLQSPSPEPVDARSSVTPTEQGDFVVAYHGSPPLFEQFDVKQIGTGEGAQAIREATGGGASPPPPPESVGRESMFDPTRDPWESVASRIGGARQGPSLIERVKTAVQDTYRQYSNGNHPINQLTRAMQEGGPLPDIENPNFLNRLVELSPSRAQYMVERGMVDIHGNKTGEGLYDILAAVDKVDAKATENKNFWTYAFAKWAVEKADQAKETGVEIDAARQVAAEGDATYHDLLLRVMAWRNGTLKYYADSGMLSRETYEKFVTENQYGIPGYRIDPEKSSAPGAGPGRTTYQSVKEFLGSDKQVRNAIESLTSDALIRVELANRNRLNTALFEGGEKIGQAGRQVGHPIKFELTPKELENFDLGGLEDGGLDAAIFRHVGQRVAFDEVPVYKDGKLIRVKFEDVNLMRLLRGYDQPTMSTLQRIFARLTSVTRGLITLDPTFPVKMLAYDLPQSAITEPKFRNTVEMAVRGLGDVLGNTPGYDRWLRSGGAAAGFDHFTKDQYLKKVLRDQADPTFLDGVWNVIRSPYDALKAWSLFLGKGLRVGRYLEGREAGESNIRAAVASSEISVPSPGAGGPHSKIINTVQPFFTAYISGLERTARGQLGLSNPTMSSGPKTAGQVALDAAKFSTAASALVTLPMLYQWWQYRDEPWYKAAPDWQKDNGLFFPIADGVTIFVKYPPIISFLYGGLPRRLLEAYVKDNPHAWDGIGKSLGASLLPPGGLINYNIFLPMIEHAANHSFFRDRPLVSDTVRKNVLAPEAFSPYSTETAKGLARYVNDIPLVKEMQLSAPVIDNYVQGWGGSLGRGAIQAAELALREGGVIKPNAPAAPIWEWPLFSSFLARYPSASAAPIRQFQERTDNFQAVSGSLKKAMELGDLPRFKQLLGENPNAAALHLMQFQGAKGLIVGGQAEKATFIDLLKDAGQHADLATVRAIKEAEAALKNMREYTLLVNVAETPQIRATIEKIKPTGVSPVFSLTALDKRQILDQSFAWMQVVAERANMAMDKAGMK